MPTVYALACLLAVAACLSVLGVGAVRRANRSSRTRGSSKQGPQTAFTISDPTSPIGHLAGTFGEMAAKLGLGEPERARIMRALREGEERLQVAQDVAGLGVWDWDHLSGRIAWSPQMFRVTGLSPELGEADLLSAWLNALHPEDRGRMEREVMHLLRSLQPLTAEYRIIDSDGSLRWLLMRAQSLPDDAGKPLRTVIVNLDITPSKESEARERFLLALSDRIRDLIRPGEILATVTESLGRHLSVCRLGYGEVSASTMVLTPLADWHVDGLPADRKPYALTSFGPVLGDELRAGRTVVVGSIASDPRIEGCRGAFMAIQVAAFICVPLVKEGQLRAVLYAQSTAPRHWPPCEIELCRDVAERAWAAFERARSNARQNLLINELNHRVKNTLATVQSIAAQSFKSGQSKAAQEAFEARLFALSKTHDVLTRENWEGANLYDIVAEAMAPYAKDHAERFRIAGEPLQLRPRMALTLAMAMHELSTNAAKYGAFSTETGHVDVRWHVDGAGDVRHLILHWQEWGGPQVQVPARKGFGSRLIERGLTRELGGEVDLDYRSDGLVCAFRIPLPDKEEGGTDDILGLA
ncbi:sensor histidine kinase [Microvirga lenta]|uniref:sensor histidine kinase n=1 Tax=Microvirga lenta TaxID=2881337 RepID=UPI001CFF2F1A|nr:HWE histidine kinase domain-containing protein [Microvirga lenta]MCB5174257.1 PAS domain-containing protein [Microvirga lenta]